MTGLLAFTSLNAGPPDYIRANVQYSTETRYPRFAGVPQLTVPPVGELPKYYRTLEFSGGTDYAYGPLDANNAGGTPHQDRSELSGNITWSYNRTTEEVSWTNTTLVKYG